MFAALSATNEAIMRAKSRNELFDMVCEAAANGGRFTSATIALAKPGSDLLQDRCRRRARRRRRRGTSRLSIDEARPEGRGLCGTAFRTRRPCITNDYVTDRRVAAFQAVVGSFGAQSGAAFPLLVRGEPVGVMIYMSAGKDTFTAGIFGTAAAIGRQCGVRDGEFRPRRRQGTDRGPERTPDAHAGGAELDQRSDHPSHLSGRIVRSGLRSGGEWWQIYLDLHRADKARQRLSRRRRCRRPDRLERAPSTISTNAAHPEGRGAAVRRSFAAGLHYQRLSWRSAQPRRSTPPLARTAQIPARPSLVRARTGHRRSRLSLSTEKDTFTPEFAESAAASRRQRVVRAGKFRSRR